MDSQAEMDSAQPSDDASLPSTSQEPTSSSAGQYSFPSLTSLLLVLSHLNLLSSLLTTSLSLFRLEFYRSLSLQTPAVVCSPSPLAALWPSTLCQ